MRFTILLGLFLIAAIGCGKNPSAPPAREEKDTPGNSPSPDTPDSQRTKLLSNLKSSKPELRRSAAEELSGWVDSDSEAVNALIELLKDRSTSGSGKILVTQVNSSREAAARALLWGGPKGEAALKDKGFAVLRQGLADKDAAIREHTAYTIGVLGPLARPLSPDVLKLCTDADANVRGTAFDTLRSIGVTDVPAFVALLNHENREIGRLAAEQIVDFSDIPDAAIPSLITALGSEDSSIRVGAARGIATVGPKAAAAAPALAAAAKAAYPDTIPKGPQVLGSEQVFWQALKRLGPEAVKPTADLLTHKNPVARAFAARTLGDLGPTAKSVADKLKKALMDEYGIVVVEAAVALVLIGEGKEEALALMKRAMDAPNEVAQEAISAIPRMGEAGKPLIEPALGKLSSDNPYARLGAVELIGTFPPALAAKYVAELGKLAIDPISAIRSEVGRVLEKLGPAAAPAAAALGDALKGEMEEPARDQFIDALAALGAGAKPALPTLLTLATDKSLILSRRLRVIAAIPTIDPSSKEVLAALLAAAGDSTTEVRAVTATALGKLDPLPPEALAKLVALAKSDARYSPKLAAIRALAVAGPRAKSVRGDVQALSEGQQAGLALWAKVALAAMDGDVSRSAAAVRSALTEKRPAARSAAAEALLLVGPTMADLPALLKLLKDIDTKSREAAARDIGSLGANAKEAVPALVLLLNDGDTDVRIAAVEALGEMGPAGQPAVEKLKDIRRDVLVWPAARKALEKLGVKEK